MFRAKKFAALLLVIFVLLLISHKSRPNAPVPPPPRPDGRVMGTLERAVANATLGFQRIFAINLPSRTDRRDSMSLAAALTDITLSYSDGVDGRDVSDRVLPVNRKGKHISKGNIGSWRAHINVLRTIVEQNLTTALIIEDDVDWDVRLKAQLQNLSLATRAYLQPIEGGRGHASLSSLHGTERQEDEAQMNGEYNKETQSTDIPLPEAPRTVRPRTSPYGDGWDVLWLGHCGTEFPPRRRGREGQWGGPERGDDDDAHLPPPSDLRVTIPDDVTVAAPTHLRAHPFALRDELAALYPPHTRVVHASAGTLCTQAYAVSRGGARAILLRLGVESLTAGFDLMLRDWCDGGVGGGGAGGDRGGREAPACLTVQPPLFSHFSVEGAGSDIQGQGGGYVRDGGGGRSQYVRLSVRRNFGGMIRGLEERELTDQWPDDGVD